MQYGDPYGKPGPPSSGPGSGGGIGTGDGGGVGPGDGPGLGPGSGGGVTTTRSQRGSFSGPTLVFKVEPEYTDDARKARLQGLVSLVAEVGADGRIRSARVVRGLGMGLDERAMEAVTQWRFRPARRDGVAVAAPAIIEVHFHLL